MKIYELNLTTANMHYPQRIAKLHILAFPQFFLTQLGKGFLTTLYQGYLEDADSGIIVAERNNRICGFIAYSNDYSNLYKELVRKHCLKFAVYSLLAVLKHPRFLKRLARAFKKSDQVKRRDPYVELASIGVNPKDRGRGVGSHLVKYLVEHTDFTKFSYISLETDADNNADINRFYKNCGFELIKTYSTPEGRRMNEYHFTKSV